MTDSKYLIEFDSAEAAERAAWMLQGEWVNQTQVWVPSHNLNPLTLALHPPIAIALLERSLAIRRSPYSINK